MQVNCVRYKENYLKKHNKDIFNEINKFCEINDLINIKWSRKVYHFLNKIPNIPKCKICDNNINQFRGMNKGYTGIYCSNRCASSDSDNINKRKSTLKKTINDKYGVDNVFQLNIIKDKIKNTNLKRYGYENPNKCREVRIKIENTNLERYGHKSPLSNRDIRNKINKTNLERYGVSNLFISEFIKDKIKHSIFLKYGGFGMSSNIISKRQRQTCKLRYGTNNFFSSSKFKSDNKYNYYHSDEFNNIITNRYINKLKIKDLIYENGIFKIKCYRCGEIFKINTSLLDNRIKNNTILCTICVPKSSLSSSKEIEILDYIKKIYNGEIIKGDRKILDGKEIDIYLPYIKLAFEFNGDYWHSDLFKYKKYHIDKLLKCYSKGIKLIHIWEHDYINNIEYTLSNIKYHIENYNIDRVIESVGGDIRIYENKYLKIYKLPTIIYLPFLFILQK